MRPVIVSREPLDEVNVVSCANVPVLVSRRVPAIVCAASIVTWLKLKPVDCMVTVVAALTSPTRFA